MEFKLQPYSKNLFPISAVLVRHASPRFWLQELQRMGFKLSEIAVFPVPSLVANVLYGCIIVYKLKPKSLEIGKNLFFQNINNKLFIPENTTVSPMISSAEMEQVFPEQYHVFHNDFGLVTLTEEVNWAEIIADFSEVSPTIIVPAKSVAIPKSITSLRIEVDEETILKQLEIPKTEQEVLDNLPFDMKKVLKGNQKEIDKFLKYLEKNPEMALQLGIPLDLMNTSRGDSSGIFSFGKNGSNWFNFGNFFDKKSSNSSNGGFLSNVFPSFGNTGNGSTTNGRYIFFKIIFVVFLLSKIISVGSLFLILKWLLILGVLAAIIYFVLNLSEGNSANISPKPANNYQNYSTSNSKNTDNKFPIIAVVVLVAMSFLFVKFLTSDAIDRSISPIIYIIGFFIAIILILYLIVKFLDKSGAGAQGGFNKGNAALLDSERFSTLHKRYEDLAQDFIAKKEYEKAAQVYLKLLQNSAKAAEVLEEGKLYQEAAIVYLKHCQNKLKAAECYEKGKAYKEAIAIYKELENTEKVGDLYLLMNQKASANEYFYKVVEGYKLNSQYIKASLILRNKIADVTQAQELLLDGWRSNKDAANCLNYYFYNIENETILKSEISRIYKEETSDDKLEIFLTVIKKEFEKSGDLKVLTKDMAYEIVAKRIHHNPQVASELLSFNKLDKNIQKDIMKYRLNFKKK